MRDLIAKIEKLDGPDREVDAEIASALLGRKIGVAKYTASLDVAVALVERVLPGWWWLKPYWNIMSVYRHGDGDVESVEYSATHHVNAIALVLATLKAMEAQDG